MSSVCSETNGERKGKKFNLFCDRDQLFEQK